MTDRADFIVIGGGIIGLALARELVRRGHRDIIVLEKESKLGVHASGRNSGVLHAGIYYSTDSIKAKVCSRGAKLMKGFAVEHGIRVTSTGKVIVATRESDIPQLETLESRARLNGIPIERVDVRQLKNIEPLAATVGFALFSPETAIIDSKAVLEALEGDLTSQGVRVWKDEEVIAVEAGATIVRTRSRVVTYGHLLNAAGTQADRIAHQTGAGLQYRILPFKGLYRKLRPEAASRVRGLIYPAPDLALPFLGVHLTRTISGDVLAGPTAIPALGRENYGWFKGLSLNEAPIMMCDLAAMAWRDEGGFRRMVKEELGKYRPSQFVQAVRTLAPELKAEDFEAGFHKVGIRAQLVDKRRLKLVMDFVIERQPRITHVLNAVSPAFTASFSFAELVIDQALGQTNRPVMSPAEIRS